MITDVDGKEYIDFRLGYGPIILGYGDERVDHSVITQISRGGTLMVSLQLSILKLFSKLKLMSKY